MKWRALALTVGLLVFTAAPAVACGADTDCRVEGGHYRIALPKNAGNVPGLIFLHGWKASADGTMRNVRLRARAEALGVALIVPQGAGDTWSYPGSPSRHRDEFAFFDALRADLLRRHPVDPHRLYVAGFSMGASMAWNLACARGSDYAGFIPFAGAFWDPIPTDCADPARVLLHTHGTADTVVPIRGRSIGNALRQSDALRSMERLALSAGLGAEPRDCPERRTCKLWSDPGHRFEFRAHPGGHVWKPDWLADTLSELL